MNMKTNDEALEKGVPYFPFRLKKMGQSGYFLIDSHQKQNSLKINQSAAFILKMADGQRSFTEIAKSVSDAFPNIEGNGEVQKRLSDFFNVLTDKELVWWRSEKIKAIPVGPPENIFWEITAQCNLRCKHCVVGAGKKLKDELSTERCIRLVEEMANYGVTSVAFSGGEPLIHPDFKLLVNKVIALGMEVQIATNGTLIDKDFAQWIYEINAGIQVSIDGSTPEIHDFMRPGTDAFKKAIHGIELLVQAGNKVTIGCVLTTKNYDDIPNILKLATKLGANGFRLIPFVPKGRGKTYEELMVPPEKVKEITILLREQRNRININIADMEFEEFIDSKPCKTDIDWNRPLGCGGAIAYGTITPSGEVLPCHFFEGVRADSIKKLPFNLVWQKSRFLNFFRSLSISDLHGKCRSCTFLSTCGGSCRATNFALGDLFGSNPQCWAYKPRISHNGKTN